MNNLICSEQDVNQFFSEISFGNVLAFDYNHYPFTILDLSRNNQSLNQINLSNASEFSEYISQILEETGARFAIGRYNEDRQIYDHSQLFSGTTRRTIHLGVDLFVDSQTEVLAPLGGIVHSFQNNDLDGDYGPTIILEHFANGRRFYTLYGHLTEDSLEGLRIGMPILQGQVIGCVGDYPSNGNWPAHLHLQLITDMQGLAGDYPGVCNQEKRAEFLGLCPNPNLILQINGLN